MSDPIEAKLAELRQHQAVNAVRVAQVQAAQEAMPEQSHYPVFGRIVELAMQSAENYAAACTIIEREFFVGDNEAGWEWTGGELPTMQVYGAALEFGIRAMAKGWQFDTEQGAWADETGKAWSGSAVKRRIIGIAGEANTGEMVQR